MTRAREKMRLFSTGSHFAPADRAPAKLPPSQAPRPHPVRFALVAIVALFALFALAAMVAISSCSRHRASSAVEPPPPSVLVGAATSQTVAKSIALTGTLVGGRQSDIHFGL